MASEGWQPQEQPLRHLIQYLNDSLSGNANAQKQAEVVSVHLHLERLQELTDTVP